ncbi:autotransporter assembly complex protein TamA [Ideonella sp. BN130291]|uniref:autotransporter assembly complex protein TamA n=1 Tax=Ideonella sp. BN130291 TaxID=3112940 RepID=UPI002E26285F|nr:BamA/TamA family outer membrane protein [Ideonella sp. BN130291]
MNPSARFRPWPDLLACAMLCAGCAAPSTDPADKAPKAPPVLQLDVEAPRPLANLLRQHLDLARVNKLAAGEPLQQGELDRLVAAAPAQARELLETEGYFNAEIQVQRLGGDPPQVRVTVQPGPRTLVRDVNLQVHGPLAADTARNEATARDAQQALRNDWLLPPGSPYRDADWVHAKNAAIAQLRAQAYLAADWGATEARIDAATHWADLSGTVDSGPLFLTGPLNIEGLNHHDAQTVHNIANFGPRTPATETLLLDFQERLQKSGLFDRTTVTYEPDPARPLDTPVSVRLTERKLQEATFGVGVGANVGARATADHVHRRPFGRALIARNKVEVAQVEQRWDGEISTHTLPGLYRNLVGGSASRVTSDTDTVTSGRVRVGRAQETKTMSRLAFAEAERSVTRSALGRSTSDSLALHYQGIWRDVDDPLLPTRGKVWNGQVGAGVARSDPGTHGPFTRLYARLDAYRPLGSWYTQGRLELGQVFARDDVVVPETLRFRAGGDESVRGYAYRSLTPQQNGVAVSGRVLFTASAEIAHPLMARMPQLWGAAFVDAGRAARTWGELKPAVGVGVGVRYRSPVGPVKLDLAYGEEVRRFRLHLTVGTSF